MSSSMANRRNTLFELPIFTTHRQRRTQSLSIAQIPAISSAVYPRQKPLTLTDLPTEILEQIISHALPQETNQSVYITRQRGSPDFSPQDLVNGDIRRKWSASAYPLDLLSINRRISDIAFAIIWREMAFVLSLSSTDALCFLTHALSTRQRSALRRIRLTRFMLSAEDGVGDDIWLGGRSRAPAFLAKRDDADQYRADVPRVEGLVAHLQARHPALPWIC